MDILIYVLILLTSLVIGILASRLEHKWLFKNKKYSGTIFVSKNEDKIVYSLELENDPEQLQFEKEVTFKVESSTGKEKDE